MTKLALSVIQGKAFIWNVQGAVVSKLTQKFMRIHSQPHKDVRKLREEHRMTGVLMGTMPQMSQQNVFLGVPLQLLPEEVYTLVKHGLAYMVNDVEAHRQATPQQVSDHLAAREADSEAQVQEAQQKAIAKNEAMSQLYADKIASRRAEKAQRKAALQKNSSHETVHDIVIPEASAKEAHTSYTIRIPGSSEGLPWYKPESCSYQTLEQARDAGIWTYPSTTLEEAKCRSFEELWLKGHFMGGGLRFGGDFLVYPHDPLRYHSHFSTTVIPSWSHSIRPIDLVSYGRLATGVKKAHLLCGYDSEDAKSVDFYSLEWAAMG